MKNWATGLLLLALVAGVWLIYVRLTAAVAVEVAAVRAAPIREFVDEQGQTRLPHIHLISMPFDGRIEAIDLAEGTPVKRDQLVARVVPLDLELAVAEASAELDRLEASMRENDDTSVERTTLEQSWQYVKSMDATVEAARERVRAGEAKLEFATSQLKRIRTLHETNARTDEDLNAAELDHVEAQVDYQQDKLILSALESIQAATILVPRVVQQYMDRKGLTRAVLEQQWIQAYQRWAQREADQRRGEMRSPIDGVVLERSESNERRVPAGTVLLKIGDLAALEVEADVLSQDVVAVKPGDAVEIYGPAIGLPDARGTVAKVYPAGFTKVSSLGVEQQRVKVLVRFADGELDRLRAARDLGVGYRVRLRIITAAKPKAPVIPRSALFRAADGGWQVFAVRDGAARLTTVNVGLMNDDLVEIVGPLAEGDQVILAPEATLTDGTRVKPVATTPRGAEPSGASDD